MSHVHHSNQLTNGRGIATEVRQDNTASHSLRRSERHDDRGDDPNDDRERPLQNAQIDLC